jgi:hypothetical protein
MADEQQGQGAQDQPGGGSDPPAAADPPPPPPRNLDFNDSIKGNEGDREIKATEGPD